MAIIGRLSYGNGFSTRLAVPATESPERFQYGIDFLEGMEPVEGVYLGSHKYAIGTYSPVTTIPTSFGSSLNLFETFTNEVRNRMTGSWTQTTPQLAFKESLISAAIFGEGNASVEGNPEARHIWDGFQEILSQVLPESLGFKRLRVRMPEVIVETSTGDFILDEASGGLSAVLEMSWQIFLRSRGESSLVALMDEPENHLHPSLQRDLVPAFLNAFPSVQFVIATHSPFIVTASPKSAVYALDYNEWRSVESRRLDYTNKAASAERTLMQVLGLESTMPRWAEDRFSAILERYLGSELSADRLLSLRRDLEEMGLESEFPTALATATDPNSKGSL